MDSLWFFVTVYIRAAADDVIGLNLTFYERNADSRSANHDISRQPPSQSWHFPHFM